MRNWRRVSVRTDQHYNFLTDTTITRVVMRSYGVGHPWPVKYAALDLPRWYVDLETLTADNRRPTQHEMIVQCARLARRKRHADEGLFDG